MAFQADTTTSQCERAPSDEVTFTAATNYSVLQHYLLGSRASAKNTTSGVIRARDINDRRTCAGNAFSRPHTKPFSLPSPTGLYVGD